MAKRKLNVAKMTIGDVLKHQIFFDITDKEIKDTLEYRRKYRLEAEMKKLRLKSHPIDSLQKSGYMETGEFIVAYAQICDKKQVNLTKSQRDIVIEIGNIAFHKTMRTLIELENETTGKTANGND